MPTFAWRLLPLLAILIAVVWIWRSPAVPAQDIRYLRIAVGGPESVSFAAGSALASALTRPPGMPPCSADRPCGVDGIVALAQSVSSPADILRAVAAGEAETGLAPAQLVFGARCPVGAGQAPVDLSILGDLYSEALHVIVRPGLGVTAIADIRGRRVAIGRTGTEDRRLADRILMAHGLRRADVRMVQEGGADAIAAFRAGEVDVLFRIGPLPDPVVAELAGEGAAVLLPVDGDAVAQLMDMHPFSGPGMVPAGLYGETGEVATLMQPVVWFGRPDLSPDLAAALAGALALPQNRGVLTGQDERVMLVDAAGARLAAPLHPGAAQAFGAAGTVLPCPGE